MRHLRDEFSKWSITKKLIKKVLQKIISKLPEKIPTDGLVGKIILNTSSDLSTEFILDKIFDAIERNPQILTEVSQKIKDMEDMIMEPLQKFGGTSFGTIGTGLLDGLKAWNQITGTPAEIVKKTGKNISEGLDKISNPDNPQDILIGIEQVIISPVTGIVKTGKDTIINASLYIMDGSEKILKGAEKTAENIVEKFSSWFDW